VSGCSPKEQPDPSAYAKQQEQRERERKERTAKADRIRSRLKVLREEMTRRENTWKAAVESRHPQWDKEQREHNLRILLIKWEGSNLSSVDETIRGMAIHGSRIFSHDLSGDDYRDIATQRLAIQDVLYGEFKQLISELERLDSVSDGDRWYYIYR
jgi:hypothetical protein